MRYLLILLFVVSGCADREDVTRRAIERSSREIQAAKDTSEFSTTCTGDIGAEHAYLYLFRCENKEVICYTGGTGDGGISCKFKTLP